jgi:hypothetical protein
MHVKWNDIPGPGRWHPLVQFKPNEPIRMRLCQDRRAWKSTLLHWANDLERTVPCTQDDECPYCPLSTRVCVYVPCMMLGRFEMRWHKAILPVQESLMGVLDIDHFLFAIDAVRRGAKNAPIRWNAVQANSEMPVCPQFDVTDSLYRCWGVRVEKRHRACDGPPEGEGI